MLSDLDVTSLGIDGGQNIGYEFGKIEESLSFCPS